MDKLLVAKRVVSAAVGFSVTKIVSAVIENNIQPSDKPIDRAAIAAGTYVLGGIAADASKKYTDAKIDELVAWYKETRAKFQS